MCRKSETKSIIILAEIVEASFSRIVRYVIVG